MEGIITAWGRILRGYKPSLSIEITRECPLRCPGCYAYGDEHLGGDVTLATGHRLQGTGARRSRAGDRRGGKADPRFDRRRRAARPLPRAATDSALAGGTRHLLPAGHQRGPADSRRVGAAIPRLQIVVSIDGLQPEHDARRTPATYDRILKHIVGHKITVHCTVTRQQVQRDGYLEEFIRLWSAHAEREPDLDQPLHAAGRRSGGRDPRPADRERVVAALMSLRHRYPKLAMPEGLIKNVRKPAQESRRMCFRADDQLHLGRLRPPDHAVPVRRHA